MGKGVAYRHGFAHVQGEFYIAREEAQQSSWTPMLASVFDSDMPQEEYPWLGQTPKLRKWTGERSAQQLRDDVITLINEEWETGIKIPIREWRRDKTGQLRVRVGELAQEIVEHPMYLIGQLLLANGNAYDGVAYYSGSHAVGGVTIDNDLGTGDGLAGGATPTVAQQATNIQKLLQALLSFKGDQGTPLNRRAKGFTIMVPTNMLGATVGALNDQFVTSGVSNTMQGIKAFGYTFSVIVNPDLDGVANTMHMFRDDGRVKPFIYQEEVTNERGLDENSEWAHMNKHVRWDVDVSCAAGYGRFEYAARGVLS
jgi:phage major head subunit gpT-like protein